MTAIVVCPTCQTPHAPGRYTPYCNAECMHKAHKAQKQAQPPPVRKPGLQRRHSRDNRD